MINQKYRLITIFGAVILRVSSVWPVNGCLWLTALVSFDISLVSLAESCLLDLSWASFRPLNSGKTFQRFQSLCTERKRHDEGREHFLQHRSVNRERLLCVGVSNRSIWTALLLFQQLGGKSSLWLLLFWFQVLLWRHFCDVTWFVLNWICYCTYLHQKEAVEEVQASVRKPPGYLQRYSWLVRQGGDPEPEPKHAGGIISHLAWECFRICWDDLMDVDGERDVSFMLLLPTQGTGWVGEKWMWLVFRRWCGSVGLHFTAEGLYTFILEAKVIYFGRSAVISKPYTTVDTWTSQTLEASWKEWCGFEIEFEINSVTGAVSAATLRTLIYVGELREVTRSVRR